MELGIHSPLPRRKDFRIGILGSGFIVNECHLVAYRKAGFNPVAIASRNRDNAARVAAKHNIPKVDNTYDDLLADPGIEVLDIAVPPNALLPLIRKACERRTVKGILAQKPLGMNLAEALEAVKLCENAGITLAVNQNMRFDQSVRAAKTLLTNGTIGDPVVATIEMRGIPHWQPWQAELGWATLRIMSIHHLDTFRYWFGMPERIFCSTRPDPRTNFPHTDGICTYVLEYANGLRCIAIDDTWTGPAKEGCPADNYIKWRVEGSNGLAIGDIGWCKNPYTTPSTIRYASKGMEKFECPTWTESWFPDAFIGTMADLLIALEKNVHPTISGRDNLQTMKLVEAAFRSAEHHQTANLSESGTSISVAHRTEMWVERTCEPGQVIPGVPLSPRAQRVLGLARKEADRLLHNYVGTEHLLLGLLRLEEGVSITVLRRLGLDLDKVRADLEKLVGKRLEQTIGNIPYTPRCKKVLAMAARHAKHLNHTYIGTEHILLGLLDEKEGFTARIFQDFDINAKAVSEEILNELDPDRKGGDSK